MPNGNQIIPDGPFDGEILDIVLELDRYGNMVVFWNVRVMGGRYDGAMPPKQYHLKSPSAWASLVREAGILGIAIHDVRELEAKKGEFAGARARFSAKTNQDGFQVIRVVRPLPKTKL